MAPRDFMSECIAVIVNFWRSFGAYMAADVYQSDDLTCLSDVTFWV